MASDAREITEARTRYAEEVASVVAPRGAGSKRRGHSGQGSPNQAGAEIAGGTDGSRTLPWRKGDSNCWSHRLEGSECLEVKGRSGSSKSGRLEGAQQQVRSGLTAGGEADSNCWSLYGSRVFDRVQKSVEQLLDAKDEAWPIGRQKSQAVLPFYEKRGS